MFRQHHVNPLTASWFVTILMTVLAAAIRLSDLDRVPHLVFDETYYVKDGWSLWRLGYEGTWPEAQDPAFVAGKTSGLSTIGSFIVHPPVGKWLIGAGMQLFGQADPFGWRFAGAVAGIVGVLLVCRLAWNLFHSLFLTLAGGLFLATDGIHVVMSRLGLVDIFLSTFVLAAFLAVVKDQQQRSARSATIGEAPPGELIAIHVGSQWQASAWNRPWLVSAGVLLGFACATKWSGIYAVMVLGIFTAWREAVLRRGAKQEGWWWKTIFPGGVAAFVYLVVIAAAVYVATWAGWLASAGAWGRTPGTTSVGGRLSDLWRYHQKMLEFHTGLTAEHSYQSFPAGWLPQIRPTSMWFADTVDGCGTEHCVSVILALGNPLLWWSGVVALPFLVWFSIRNSRWETALILGGFVALYLPWFLYPERTMFTFYTVAFVPFVALTVAWFIRWVAVTSARSERYRLAGLLGAGLLVVMILVSAVYFAPIWTGYPLDFDSWVQRMWLESWI